MMQCILLIPLGGETTQGSRRIKERVAQTSVLRTIANHMM